MKTTFTTVNPLSYKTGLVSLVMLMIASFSNTADGQACGAVTSSSNLIKNSNFESNCNYWGTTNGNIYTGTGYQVCGAQNGYLSSPNNGTPSWAFTEVDLRPAGTNLSFSGYFGTHTVGQSCSPIIRMAFYNSSWTLISADTKNVTTDVDKPPYKAGLYVINSKVPANTAHIRFEVRISCDYMKMDAMALSQVSLLPVKLMNFNAILTDKTAKLNWKTSSEVNFNYFTVEKSTDGINFSDAGVVFATGSNNSETAYAMNDNLANTDAPVVYYRLRMTDNDGSTSYSEIKMLRLTKQTQTTISLLTYPNPAVNDLKITLPATWQNKRAIFEIVNLNGQVVNRMENANTSQTEMMNVAKLAPGLYVVRVTCEGQVAQQKIVKQ
ncbi:MAG: T9SS type A sorting domain-containing protein [Bacteroidetes bacterium]|nr:T9SS type A sorting domain-containing protein [Bacteroidota bacterium]